MYDGIEINYVCNEKEGYISFDQCAVSECVTVLGDLSQAQQRVDTKDSLE